MPLPQDTLPARAYDAVSASGPPQGPLAGRAYGAQTGHTVLLAEGGRHVRDTPCLASPLFYAREPSPVEVSPAGRDACLTLTQGRPHAALSAAGRVRPLYPIILGPYALPRVALQAGLLMAPVPSFARRVCVRVPLPAVLGLRATAL